MRIRVFVIDDEPNIIGVVKDGLAPEEFMVQGAKDPDQGLEAIGRIIPDILLLDWNLPGRSGLELCRLIRKHEATRDLPIIMLTVMDRVTNKVEALDAGADDYVTKPFDITELAARIKAVLRRRNSGVVPSQVLKRGKLMVDGTSYSARVDGKPVALSTMEFEILYLLAAHEGRPMTRQMLLDHVCPETTDTLRTVDVHIQHLRSKLGPVAGDYIKTMHRIGYMFGVAA